MKKSIYFPVFILIIILISVPAYSQDYVRKSLNVTVYNSDLGVIRDVRSLDIKKGISDIKITDVAQYIDPTSVHIKLDGTVLEQNYQYDLVNLYKVLAKYIDKEITLTSDKNSLSGTLLSDNSGELVLRKSDGGLLMLPKIDNYQISVGSLPDGLITKPTLIWTVDANSTGKQDVELSYQTSGMKWHAEYVAVLNNDDTKMDLNSWVSVENNSGATYKDAQLKLVAGDVNLITPENLTPRYGAKEYALAPAQPQFQEKEFFEYHIYNLQRPTTIAQNETKQVSLFEAGNIKIHKKYLYRSGYYYNNSKKVAVVVEFENKKENNLGMPMPKGKVRLYKSDGETIEFIGEDQIDHTPKNETIKLKVGDAFDIVVEDIEKEQKRISDKVQDHIYQVTLKNRKNENVVVEVERQLGYNWEILNSSMKYEQKNAQTVLFKVPVDKDSETVLNFAVRYSY